MSADAARRIAELSRRYRLSGGQSGQLAALASLLAADQLAPTAVRAADLAVDTHLADSLVALELGLLQEVQTIVDIGAGAGFPGLALAVALPGSQVALVDSQARKCAFLERAIEAAGIANAEAVCTRVEQWPKGIGRHGAALARAVAAQPVVLEYAAPLLCLGGVLIDWRGRRDSAGEAAALRACSQLGLERERIVLTKPFAAARDHHLHVFVKTAETPPRFPRRVGTARKRPLG